MALILAGKCQLHNLARRKIGKLELAGKSTLTTKQTYYINALVKS
jgi:hypothetical protein